MPLLLCPPLSSLVIPRTKKRHRGPFYDNLLPPARSGAPENFGQSQILLENISFYDHSPVNFAKSPFFHIYIYINKSRKFTSAVFAPHQQTAAQNTLRHQKPLFFPHFSATTAPRRPCSWKSKQKPQTHQVYFFRPDNGSTLKMQSNQQHQSRIFHQNHISTVHSSDCQKPPIFIVRTSTWVDNQLTCKQEKRWTTS